MAGSFVTRSYRLKGSGITDVMMARGARRRVLVIGCAGMASLQQAWITRSRPAGGFVGCSVSGQVPGTDDDDTLWTKADSSPTNLSMGQYIDVWRTDQPNSAGQTYGRFWDTDVTIGDGSSGLENVTLSGTKEYIWAGGADVTADAQILAATLAAHTQVKSPDWYKDELACRFIWHAPAADGAGTFPIVGGPSLKIGTRRGVAAYSLGSASTATTAAQLSSAAGTLAAGSGLPSVSVNSGVAATNRGRRMGPLMFTVESNTAIEGLSLFFIANPEIAFDGWSGLTNSFDHDLIAELDAIVGGFDAVIYHVGDYIGGGDPFDPWNDDLAFLRLGTPGVPGPIGGGGPDGTANPVSESISDGVNMLRTQLGVSTPILLVANWYAGYGDDAEDRETIMQTFVDSVHRVASTNELDLDGTNGDHSDHRWGQPATAIINLYNNLGTVDACSATGGAQITRDPDNGDFNANASGAEMFVDAIWAAILATDTGAGYSPAPSAELSGRTQRVARATRSQR